VLGDGGRVERLAWVGILAPADRPGARRPAGKIDGRQLGDLGARAWLAAGVDRGLQAPAGTASTATRTRSSAGRLTENRTPRSRRWSTRAWVAPPVSARTSMGATRPPGQRGRQPEPVGQLHQQHGSSMSGHPIAVAGDLEPRRRLGSVPRKVPSSAREYDLLQAVFSLLRAWPLPAEQPATSTPA
jgi:hypothetical protein